MTDEVAAHDSHVSRGDELLIAEVLRYVVELYRAECAIDEMLEEHPRDAVHRSQMNVLNFLNNVGPLVRDLGFAPPNSHLPGDAVARLLMAFEDRGKGLVDPVLEPPEALETRHGPHTLFLKDRHDRVRPAVVMELLRMAGYGVKKAAGEVADMLKGHPILKNVGGDPAGTITRWWRDIKKGRADSWDTEEFNVLVAEVKKVVGARGGTAADFIKLAPALLNSNAKKRP
jgi:hypothetical protein